MKSFLKYAFKVVLFYSPKAVKQRLHRIQDEIELKKGRNIAMQYKVAKEDLDAIFNNLDLNGDVMVHTSITNLGKIKGGAKFVCETLLSKLDLQRSTLLISALPYRGSFYEYLADKPLFDVRTAPIAMGTVNERLAELQGAKRSIHPTHSVVAVGKDAYYYVKDHYKDITPFGDNSPYHKLLKRGGKILLIGATLNNVTAVHALEDILADAYPKDIYAKKIFAAQCIDQQGFPLIVNTKCHHPLKCLRRDMERMRMYLESNGSLTQYRCGAGFITLIDCKGFTDAFYTMLENGENIYGKHKVTENLIKTINNLKES